MTKGEDIQEPMPRDVVALLPPTERSVEFRRLDNGEWLVTETTIARRVQAEGPRFEVAK